MIMDKHGSLLFATGATLITHRDAASLLLALALDAELRNGLAEIVRQ